jgi:hypothetical protein
MLLKLAAALTVVALLVSPCFGQSLANPDTDRDRFSLSGSVRRAWEADAKGLLEMITSTHPRGANRCWHRKVSVADRVDCFQRLIQRHFLTQVITESTRLRSWCADDSKPERCFESLAAQEVELWRHKRMASTP